MNVNRHNMSAPTATTLAFVANSDTWSSSGEYRLDASQSVTDSVFYEVYFSNVAGDGGHGLEFRKESDGSTKVYCNTGNNTANPFTISNGTDSGASVTISSSGTLIGVHGSGPNNSFTINVTSAMLWTSGTSTESLNTGSITQNMDGSLSFQVHASSDSSETYSISLNNVDNASIVPSGVGPWYKNYTNSEHTAIGYGTWRLYDQNSILDSIPTTAPATPPAQSTDSTTSTIKKVFCNFW